MKNILRWILLLIGGQATAQAELKTVPYVDLQRYLGTWYDVASFPQRFQKGCTCTTAEYSLNKDGSIAVVNRCIKDGKEKIATAKAKVRDKKSNAKLSVQFFWPFKGKYWIIDLADDYSYAVVGHPSRDYLWILSRSPQLPSATYEGILSRLKAQGYDLSRLRKTEQTCTAK
jgi:apolipoprotein D and lipocalin family protein